MGLLTVDQALPVIGFQDSDKHRLWYAVRKGYIPHIRVGRRVFFEEDTLREWMRTGEVPTKESDE